MGSVCRRVQTYSRAVSVRMTGLTAFANFMKGANQNVTAELAENSSELLQASFISLLPTKGSAPIGAGGSHPSHFYTGVRGVHKFMTVYYIV